MDIGGTNLRTGLVNEDGTILFRRKSPCPTGKGLNGFLTGVFSEIDRNQKYATDNGMSIIAAGICVPGLVDRHGTVISSVNLQEINGYSIKLGVEQLSGLKTVILNDANGAALAEKRYGAGRPFSSLLHFTLGTGVGSGLILDNDLWCGADGVAAEYGHATVEPEGRLCSCGNHGCLEQYASSKAIARFAKERMFSENIGSAEHPEDMDTAAVAGRARNGDRIAISCFATAGRYLGIASASAVNLLNLDAIIIGGGVAGSFDLLAGYVQKEINERSFAVPAARVRVLQGELGDDAGLMGAAAAAWKLARGGEDLS
jgi:glucokinase